VNQICVAGLNANDSSTKILAAS